MASQEPKRWAEFGSDAPHAMRTLLAAARKDVPTETELRALGLIGGVVGPLDAGVDVTGPASKAAPIAKGTAGTSAATSGTFAKLALFAKLGAIGVAAVGGATWLLQPSAPATDAAPVVAVGASQTHESNAPVDAPTPQLSTALVQPTTGEPPEVAKLTPPIEGPVAARTPSTGGQRAAAPVGEAELLQRAQASLAHNPGRALALTEQHAKQFPRGQLGQEREVIRIEALRRLGRDNQAEKVGRDFERQFPDSPHRRKLDQSEP